MKLSTSGILAFIGAILVLISLFIPAAYGITAQGMNSNGKISLFEFDVGFAILIVGVLALVFAIIENFGKWAWIFGLMSIILSVITLASIVNSLSNIYSLMPMAKQFVYFGPGVFVAIFGGILVTASAFVLDDAKTKKIAGISSVIVFLLTGVFSLLLLLMLVGDDTQSTLQSNNNNYFPEIKKPIKAQSDSMEIGPMYPLDNFTVNLLNDDSHKYLKIQMNLELANEAMATEIEEKTAVLIDEITRILSSKTADKLLTSKDKDALKEEIVNRLNLKIKEGSIKNIFFTEFSILGSSSL